MLKLFLVSLILIGIAILFIGIKMLFKKGYSFRKECSCDKAEKRTYEL